VKHVGHATISESVVTCQHYQWVQSVAACDFGDVLHQLVLLQQVLQVGIELVIFTSRTAEVATYDESLLGIDKLVQHVWKLLAEQL